MVTRQQAVDEALSGLKKQSKALIDYVISEVKPLAADDTDHETIDEVVEMWSQCCDSGHCQLERVLQMGGQ